MYTKAILVGILALSCVIYAQVSERPERRRLGGFSDVSDLNDANVQNAIDVGANHIAAQSGHPCRNSLAVQRVQSQVVNGIKYRVTLRSNPAQCQNDLGPAKICTVDVVRRDWLQEVTPSRPRCKDA